MVSPQPQGTVQFGTIISENAGLSLAGGDARKCQTIPPSACLTNDKKHQINVVIYASSLKKS